MKHRLQWLRSLVFVGQMYFMMLPIGLLWLPWMMVSREGARHACKSYARWSVWTARWMVGLRVEVRGPVPQDEVLIAAKHQSFLDAMVIFAAVPKGKFIMKRSLLYAPILGQYAWRLGCVPVSRGKRAEAIRQMKRDVAAGQAEAGQLIIYPQGTRVPPGVSAPYKVGSAVLYEQLGQDCVPVACNVGVFWPRVGIMRHPGLAVVEFLPRIPAGLPLRDFSAQMAQQIEEASERLHREAVDG